MTYDWNDERTAMLRAAWIAGHSAREIADTLNATTGGETTKNAVIGKAYRLELPLHRNWTGGFGRTVLGRRG